MTAISGENPGASPRFFRRVHGEFDAIMYPHAWRPVKNSSPRWYSSAPPAAASMRRPYTGRSFPWSFSLLDTRRLSIFRTAVADKWLDVGEGMW